MNRVTSKASKGFTLIELMIVVAIIGILAAIAIPNFMRFQLKSKSSEGKVNLAAIRTAEESYMAEFGRYIAATTSPAAYGGSSKIPFVDVGAAGANFDTIGWAPEGQVFFQYQVTLAGTTGFTGDAAADIDADGVAQSWGYVKPDPAGVTVAGSLGAVPCATTGTWDAGAAVPAATALATVGPCDSASGNSVF